MSPNDSLRHGITSGSEDEVCLALDNGADINCRDARGVTPLHLAAGIGDLRAAVLLLDHGADMHAIDAGGWRTQSRQSAFGAGMRS